MRRSHHTSSGFGQEGGGTVFIGIDAENRKMSLPQSYPPRRPEVKRRAVLAALFELRQLLLDW